MILMRLLLKRASTSKDSSFFLHVYAATLLVAFHYYLVTYVNSTFLNQYFSSVTISWLYAAGAILNIVVFLNIAKLLNRFGTRKSVIVFATLELAALLCLAFSRELWLIILAFIVHDTMFPTLVFHLDILTESATKTEKTGSVRGTFLSLLSVAALVAPAIVGHIVDGGRFFEIYLISACFIGVFILVIFFFFRSFGDKPYKVFKARDVAQEFFGNPDIRNAAISNFFLQFFYCWMLIYVPIYLYHYVGFSWTDIGLIISASILPFVLFEFPLGELADRRLREKTILLSGFCICIAALLVFPFLSGTHFFEWTLVLFIARTGACCIEVSSESYFFRQITAANGELMSFWRMDIPVAYIAGTIVGSLSLAFVPYRFIFWMLAAVMTCGLLVAMRLHDKFNTSRVS
jgi:MFS family permease